MNVLIDTGVWYAFFDQRERPQERDEVDALLESVRFAKVILPWPVVYETVRTRLSRNIEALRGLEKFMSRLDLEFIDDYSYRDAALQLVFDMSLHKRPPRPLSMVDCLLRLIIDDTSLKIDKFITYNERDFSDICRTRKVEMTR